MEKVTASTVTDLACVTALNSPPPSLSTNSEKSNNKKHQEEFAASFASLYSSIFSPEESQFPISLSLSPSPPSSSSPPGRFDTTTEHRLRQARLILEYDELNEHYELCINRLQSLLTEIGLLRQENDALLHENSDLLKLIHISTSPSSVSPPPLHYRQFRQENDALRHENSDLLKLINISTSSSSVSPPPLHKRQYRQQISNFRSQSTVHNHSRSARRNNPERISVPKSISVRSPRYLKINQGRSHGCGGAANRQMSQLGSDSVSSHKVCVPTKGEKEALELEVYRQGMMKTELCNKWEETGACPYGDNCQFAHGIDELRPVIRHPRYKTQVCRMLVTGATCPYGHRCHFRHSLTEQERMMLLTR